MLKVSSTYSYFEVKNYKDCGPTQWLFGHKKAV